MSTVLTGVSDSLYSFCLVSQQRFVQGSLFLLISIFHQWQMSSLKDNTILIINIPEIKGIIKNANFNANLVKMGRNIRN